MPSLSLGELRQEVSHLHGPAQWELVKPCIHSLADRQFYAKFHFERARTGLTSYVRIHLASEDDQFSILSGQDEEGGKRFNIVIRKLAADITACIQSIHTLPDILASAVYYSLALDRTHQPKDGKFVNHQFVVSVLHEIQGSDMIRNALRYMTLNPG